MFQESATISEKDAAFRELLEERAVIEAKIEAARLEMHGEALALVRKLVADHSLTEKEVFGAQRKAEADKKPVEPKYRDPATGRTWSGRGKPPSWIAGKDRAQFLIQP